MKLFAAADKYCKCDFVIQENFLIVKIFMFGLTTTFYYWLTCLKSRNF
jgi:hypothetical protein